MDGGGGGGVGKIEILDTAGIGSQKRCFLMNASQQFCNLL